MAKEPMWGVIIDRHWNERAKALEYRFFLSPRYPLPKPTRSQGPYIVLRRRSELFATSPAIRAAAEKMGLQAPAYLGNIDVAVMKGEGGVGLMTVDYHPLDGLQARKHLRGKGVASLLELLVEKDLKKTFPGARITSTMWPTRSRSRQLRKRGRKPGEILSIEEAYERTKAYVVREHKESKLPRWKRKVNRVKRGFKRLFRR